MDFNQEDPHNWFWIPISDFTNKNQEKQTECGLLAENKPKSVSRLAQEDPELSKLHSWSYILFGKFLSSIFFLSFFFKYQSDLLVDPPLSSLYIIETDILFRVSDHLDILQSL